jgi:hypothetical protein
MGSFSENTWDFETEQVAEISTLDEKVKNLLSSIW